MSDKKPSLRDMSRRSYLALLGVTGSGAAALGSVDSTESNDKLAAGGFESNLTEFSSRDQYATGPDGLFDLSQLQENEIYWKTGSGEFGVKGPDGPERPPLDVPAVSTEDSETKDQPVRDVRSYGAVGDGSTDDTAAIQAALDAGGIIWIPHGHTFRADGLGTANTVKVGGGGTLKRRDADGGGDYVLTLNGDGSFIRDVTLDGAADTTNETGRGANLHLGGNYCTAFNVTSRNTIAGNNAATIAASGYWPLISHCWSTGAGGQGILMTNTGRIHQCHVDDWGFRGICCTGDPEITEVIYQYVSECTILEGSTNPDGDDADALLFDYNTEGMVCLAEEMHIDTDAAGNIVKFDEHVIFGGIKDSFISGSSGVGDLLRLNGGKLVAENCRFEGDGRVAPRTSARNVTLRDCELRNSQGYSVRTTSPHLDLVNCDFMADGVEGAIRGDWEGTAGEIHIDGCYFDQGDSSAIVSSNGTPPHGAVTIEDFEVATGADSWSSSYTAGYHYGGPDALFLIDGTSTETASATEPQGDWPKGAEIEFTEDGGDGSNDGWYKRVYDGSWAKIA